ncbi:NADH-cytochrome b5 reductase [Melia azedarach]|uniref:NADH-cytochrome b5 reductase n=1 Tax=Melia azedarach TaxID=155640 RepID=A0ACC1YMA4_MELAZ|nr:NADH-cytochrome b5 reductase [Melia azedarach]
MLIIVVALVSIGSSTAYYLYITQKSKGCLDPENFKEFKLVKCTQLSHNVAKLKFALPTPTSVLDLLIEQHMSCRAQFP